MCKQSENVFPLISLQVCLSPWLCVHLFCKYNPIICKDNDTTDITDLSLHFTCVSIWRASLFPEVLN